MKKQSVNYLAVGLFVLGMFVLLMVILYRITGREGDTEAYYVVYSNITGVQVGTAVTYGGYQIGQVQQISPVRNGGTRFKLRLGIKKGWKIPEDSVARVISPGMLSDNLINIVEGDSTQYLSPGEQLRGREEISMMSLLNSMAYELKTLSDESIKPLLENLNNQVSTIGSDLSEKIPRITANTNQLLAQLQASAENLNGLFSEENRGHFASVVRNADRLSENLVRLSERFSEARGGLDELLENSNALILDNREDIRESVIALRQSMDTISQNIDTVVYHLEVASRNMNEFSRQIRQNPGLLLGGSTPKPREGAKQ